MPKRHNAKDVKGDAIHPFSRKATQLQRAILRGDKLSRQKKMHTDGNTVVPKLLWLHDNLTEGKEEYSEEEAHALIELYLERYREEMDELESQVRKNRPKPSRLTLLNAMHDSEKQSYELGSFEMPDLSVKKNVAFVGQFTGDVNSLDQVSLRFYKQPLSSSSGSASSSSAAAAAVDNAEGMSI